MLVDRVPPLTVAAIAAPRRYVQPETIEGFRPDELDGRETTLTKALLFARLPQCLLIQLKRFMCVPFPHTCRPRPAGATP